MRRPIQTENDATGQNSFLDVVTNIVGILIILVIVVGLRVKNAPVKQAQEQAIHQASMAMETQLAGENRLHGDVNRATEQAQQLQGEMIKRSRERAYLATSVATLERDITRARSQLEVESRNTFELHRKIEDAQRDLSDLERQRTAVERGGVEPIVVDHSPSPLTKRDGDGEIHFQLRGGRIVFIPLDRLVEQFKTDAHQKAYRLLEVPELTETVGPEGGFRLLYTLERRAPPREKRPTTSQGTYAQMKRWTLLPVADHLGETIDAALAGKSEFRKALASREPERTTVMIWTYPDSFVEFGRIKRELSQLGFATAGRPLPEGVPITATPEALREPIREE